MRHDYTEPAIGTAEVDQNSEVFGGGLRWRWLPLLLAALLLEVAPAEAESAKADRIVVFKAARVLELRSGGTVLKRYPIALGRRPKGTKVRRGDGRTPEGIYVVDGRNPDSAYHRSLHLSYPNERDLVRARAVGARPGQDIFIHGMPEWYGPYDPVRFTRDWTEGCIAVGNTAIEQIWAAVDDGTAVEIRP
jgi:murein L,D-transpeptidase YafK